MMNRVLVSFVFCALSAMVVSPAASADTKKTDQVYIRALTGDAKLKEARVNGAGEMLCRSVEEALSPKRALCYDVVQRLLMLTATQASLGAMGGNSANPVQARMDRTQYVVWGHVRPGKHGMILEVNVSTPLESNGDPVGNPERQVTFRRKGIKTYDELEKYATQLGKRAAAHAAKQKPARTAPPPTMR